MKKKITWYVYDASATRRRYLGLVKTKTGKKAVEIAHRRWADLPLDVIRKKYVQDRDLGTMRGPKKKA